jgi:TldD protein
MPDEPRGLDAIASKAIAEAVLARASEMGASNAEVRVESRRHQYVGLRDGTLETSADDTALGVAFRVVKDGAIGFAATVDLSVDACVALVDTAVDAARRTGALAVAPIALAPEPVHGDQTWSGGERIDPTTVSLAEKVALLGAWSAMVSVQAGIDHVQASVSATAEDKYYADLSGTTARQHRVWLHPVVEALSIDAASGGFETMRTVAPPVGRGWEYVLGEGWDFDAELAELGGHLAEKLRAPSVVPGRYDLIVDPTNLWLTIHESIGHATELDRALGYEAAYAGTSFATFDQLGSLRYGSELMNVTGDRTTPYGMASIGIDDEGVAAQAFDIVRHGVLVGYQLDRKIAAEAGFDRSNGCAYASSPLMTPIQRMANVSLAPAPGDGPGLEELISGVEHGIYVVGDKSWSIDMQRYNFQFTGQRFFAIEHGRLAGQLRDVAYQATTTEFWGSLSRLGGGSTYLLGGAVNCGKGQPGQTAPVSHGCPVAVFDGVNILNTKGEAGRS